MYRNRKYFLLISIFFVSALTLNILFYSMHAYSKESRGWSGSLSVKSMNDKDTTPFMVIETDIDVQVVPFKSQVIRGELLEVNVTVFDDGKPVEGARIKLTLKQRSTEFETTQFTKLQPGIYKTTFNTTSLTIGQWSLTAEVQTGGDTYYGEASVVIAKPSERETSKNPVFLIIPIVGICIGTVGLVYWTGTELMGKGKKRKKGRKSE